jgi:hypothetical protein
MRNTAIVVSVGAIVLGALGFGFWGGGWTSRGNVKKMAGATQKKLAQIRRNLKTAIQAATS